jgi:hypothetical protein
VAQVLTSEPWWQLDANSWAEMGKAGGELSVQVTSAYLVQNRVTEGPYQLNPPHIVRLEKP